MSPPPPTELPAARDVVGLPVRPFDTDGLIDALIQRARLGVRTTTYYLNAHTANLACGSQRFRRVLCGSELLYADGNSVVWAGRLGGVGLPERMTAADCFPRFVRPCAEHGLSLFLLGSRDGVAQRAAEHLCGQAPGLKIAGTHSGYFDLGDSPRVVAAINAAEPDILAVGMSSPRQEYWLAEHAGEIKAPVRWCVGALFDYLAGVERRAPDWLCRIGGEWFFRLCVDPIGKWRRYVIGNPLFAWNTMRWLVCRPTAG